MPTPTTNATPLASAPPITETYTGNFVTFTAQTTGTYTITATGAQGGSSKAVNGRGTTLGGNGAQVTGTFTLTAGDKIEIAVGGAGTSPVSADLTNTTFRGGGGGGGGSFVYDMTSKQLLEVAGGGGGAFSTYAGGAGLALSSGSGNGMGGYYNSFLNHEGAGGGGFKSNGQYYANGNFTGKAAKTSFPNQLYGGYAGTGSAGKGGSGGFGGGGGGSAYYGYGGASGGGGGGYTGGNSGDPTNAAVGTKKFAVGTGYGGSSFIAASATSVSSTAGFQTGNGTVTITEAPCFATGTRIATARGPVAVEDLVEGDAVTLARGGSRPVRWIGHRSIDLARHPRPLAVRPVRVAPGAFGPGLPARDLRLSPDHAVFADGVLIPVRYLINGVTIAREPVAAVTYWHVELDAHDVLLAEGLACESYLDTGNRHAFANGGAAVMAHPEFARATALATWADRACAPLRLAGPEVAATRALLLAYAADAGHATSDEPALIMLADGAVVRGVRDGARHRFALPAGARDVRLTSRVFVPAECYADSADTRQLGVAVAAIEADGVAVALGGPGWHAAEPGWRWTAGGVSLPLAGARAVTVTLALTGRYWLPDIRAA